MAAWAAPSEDGVAARGTFPNAGLAHIPRTCAARSPCPLRFRMLRPKRGADARTRPLHWWQTKRLMPLPVWIVAIRDPAYAYMLRSGGDYRRRPRLLRRRGGGHGFTGYVPLGSVRAPKPTAEEIEYLQAQAATEHRRYMARFHDNETRHGELLRATAGALAAKGTATLHTTEGDIHARIVRFRDRAVVLEVEHPGGRSQSRSSESTVAEEAVHQLANALASIRPDAEPLGS